MFQANSTTLLEKKFLLVSNLGACGLQFKGSAALLVVLMEIHPLEPSCAVDFVQPADDFECLEHVSLVAAFL